MIATLRFNLLIICALILLGFSLSNTPILRNNSGNIILECNTSYGLIKGTNHKVKSAYDALTGKLQFSVLVNDIHFNNATFEEEFSNSFMESKQFPVATFNGVINNNSQINLNKDGIYTSTITGNLKIKGISKHVMTTGSFVVAENRVKGVASFYAIPKDFNISIPSYIMTDISKKIKINVNIDFPIP